MLSLAKRSAAENGNKQLPMSIKEVISNNFDPKSEFNKSLKSAGCMLTDMKELSLLFDSNCTKKQYNLFRDAAISVGLNPFPSYYAVAKIKYTDAILYTFHRNRNQFRHKICWIILLHT